MPGSRNMHVVKDVSSFTCTNEKVVSSDPNNNGQTHCEVIMLNAPQCLPLHSENSSRQQNYLFHFDSKHKW